MNSLVVKIHLFAIHGFGWFWRHGVKCHPQVGQGWVWEGRSGSQVEQIFFSKSLRLTYNESLLTTQKWSVLWNRLDFPNAPIEVKTKMNGKVDYGSFKSQRWESASSVSSVVSSSSGSWEAPKWLSPTRLTPTRLTPTRLSLTKGVTSLPLGKPNHLVCCFAQKLCWFFCTEDTHW